MAALAIAVLLCLVLGVAIWSIKRHREPSLRLDAEGTVGELENSLSAIALATPLAGNAAELFENGAFFDAVIADIAAARHTVHFETWLWKDGAIGRRMAELFARRAREGVKVRLLLDAVGCRKMGKASRQVMREAGCDLAFYNRPSIRNIGVLLERDHRKIVVLDGEVAWVGGHCIVDHWLGDAEGPSRFRDISVRLRGPLVHAVQSAFSENWIQETGRIFIGDEAFPSLAPVGELKAHVAMMKPEGSPPAVKLLHYAALACAKKRVWIQNPYFIPDRKAVRALAEAVARGVDVRIMVPSAAVSDAPLVQHAAHRNFEELLRGGIRILEYRKTMLHQKVMVIDGDWAALGTANFDDRSMETNDEIVVAFYDAGMAGRLEEIFRRDALHCAELKLEDWRGRGLLHRLQDNVLYLANEVL